MKKTILLLSLILLFSWNNTAFSRGIRNGFNHSRISSPFLYGPCTENIQLEDKNFLEFSWKPAHDVSIIGYELKIYQGFKSVKKNLLTSQFIPGPVRAVPIPSGQFEKGKTYSWELTQIYMGGQKSKRSFCSFEVK